MNQIRNQVDPTQVTLNLLKLSHQLQQLSDGLDELEEDAVTAKEIYTVEYARSFLNSSGSVEIRRQETLLNTTKERLAADIAETKVRARKRQIETLHTRIEVGRSCSALVRAEASLLNIRQ
jgi:intein-encoded DNA endonuclease-like protein